MEIFLIGVSEPLGGYLPKGNFVFLFVVGGEDWGLTAGGGCTNVWRHRFFIVTLPFNYWVGWVGLSYLWRKPE